MGGLFLPGPAVAPVGPSIFPLSPEAMGLTPLVASTDWSGEPSSTTWPTANKAFGYPFMLSEPRTLLQMFFSNGAAVSGNLDLGVYLMDGTKVVSTGSTAQSGTSNVQVVDVTDTLLQAGVMYYCWAALDNTTGTVMRYAPTANVGEAIAGGWAKMTSAFPLPSPITPAAMDTSISPEFGLFFASAT